jgi:hypothetical protein
MRGPGTKEAAETILRELPSVVGAFVREDVNGHPREIHLLVQPGPEPRHLARDIRSLLEERLGVGIDQRIISIAQLARDPGAESTRKGVVEEAISREEPAIGPGRIRFVRCDSEVTAGRVMVLVELRDGDDLYTGEASELEAGSGRLRAGAAAALQAATAACAGRARFALDGAAQVHAADRSYTLVSCTVTSPALGRRAVALTGAQELNDEPETAAALAALKAANRVLGLVRILGSAEEEPLPLMRVRRR